MTSQQHRVSGVPDLERLIYGSVSDSRSALQRRIRRVLRSLGDGVGSGNRYQWSDAELQRLVPVVKAQING